MDNNSNNYPKGEETGNHSLASEPAAALAEQETFVIPNDVDYADVVEGILQVTPDIEEEIAAVDRGETISMSEFKTILVPPSSFLEEDSALRVLCGSARG